MRRALLIPLLFLLSISIIPTNVLHSGVQISDAQTTPGIIVQVSDQNGLFYNGVQVQIYVLAGSLVYSGTTQNGFFSSGDLSSNTNYLVVVSSGFQSKNQTVFVGNANTLVTFVLTRPLNPSLTIATVNFDPSVISPGSNFVAQITVEDSTSGSAYYTAIAFNSSSPSGVNVGGRGSVFDLGTISGNSSKSFNATFIVQDSVQTGTFQVPYTLTYQNSSNGKFISTGFLAIPVTGIPSRPVLVVSDIVFTPSIITPGSKFLTSINVTNTGSKTAYASSIGITIPSQNITLIGSTGQFNMGTLGPNSSSIANFEMTSAFNAQAGAVVVDFTLVYNNKQGTLLTSNGTFSISLSSTPDLQVQSFSLSNSPLIAGSTSDLSITVLNVGGDAAYGVSLSVAGSQFLSGNSSNYLGAILSQGTGKAVFILNIANDTAPGSYNFTLFVTYNDIEGKSYKSLDNYTLTVAQYPLPSVYITNILVDPPVLNTGVSGSITLFFKNFGTTSANNVIVQVNGGQGIVSSNYFGLGTISAGGQVTQIIGVNVDPHATAGDYTLVFNVTYTDAIGIVHHSSVPMTISIYASANLFSTKNIAIIGGVVIAVPLVGLFLRKFKII